MVTADFFHRITEAEVVTREEAPHIYSALDEMAGKLGIKTPQLRIIKFNPFSVPLAAASSRSDIVICKEMLKHFEVEALDKPITNEFKAILGHEWRHCKSFILHAWLPKITALAFPITAIAGLWMYKHAKENFPHSIKQVLSILS